MTEPRKKSKRDEIDRSEWTESERQAELKMRMRFEYRDLIEDLIQEGQERGAFDNLSGVGKPLDLQKNLYEGDRELANALMKEHKLLPPWLQKRNAVQAAIDDLRVDIERRWQRHELAYRLAQDEGRRRALSLNWSAVCRDWEAQIVEMNRLVSDFNLRRPSDNMEIIKLRLDDELKRAGAARELGR